MKVITTTAARNRLGNLINAVRFTHRPIAIGRRNRADVLMIPFPSSSDRDVSTTTKMNEYGGAFSFLEDEPDLYTADDIITTSL